MVSNDKEFHIKSNEPIMPASVVSRLLGIPIWTLKRIDEAGIVSPARKKDKMRLYSKNDLDRLKHIWYLIKEKKVKIPGLRFVLGLEKKIHSK
ncbi:MAG: MerR family transcriptional regulator [Candidatus Omnitrophica bacterium]|nr:MerR family transcriptional regulator [Candidatus Omnitrophota bacterium]